MGSASLDRFLSAFICVHHCHVLLLLYPLHPLLRPASIFRNSALSIRLQSKRILASHCSWLSEKSIARRRLRGINAGLRRPGRHRASRSRRAARPQKNQPVDLLLLLLTSVPLRLCGNPLLLFLHSSGKIIASANSVWKSGSRESSTWRALRARSSPRLRALVLTRAHLAPASETLPT